jgi:hypothetical protein
MAVVDGLKADLLAVAALFCVADALAVWRYARRPGSNRWVTLHLWLFWAFVAVFSAVGMVARDLEYELGVFVLTHALVFAYLLAFAFLATRLEPRFPPTAATLAVLQRLREWQIGLCIVPWLAFKAYLYPRYGLNSFQLLTIRQELDVPYWEAVVNSLLAFPALGALVVWLLKVAVAPRTLLRLHATLPALAFLALYGITNEAAGTRRFVAALLVWTALAYLYARQGPWRLRHLAAGFTLVVAAVSFSEYFQRVRMNLAPSLEGEGESLTSFVRFLVPESADELRTLENLRVREDPLYVLYRITEVQLDDGTRTGGALARLALEDAVPAALLPSKSFLNHDDILGETYGMLLRDVAAVPLASVLADVGLPAFALTPLAYLLALWVYCWAQARSAGSAAMALTAAGAAFLTVFRVEDGLESLLITLRDFTLAWMIAAAGAAIHRALQRRA